MNISDIVNDVLNPPPVDAGPHAGIYPLPNPVVAPGAPPAGAPPAAPPPADFDIHRERRALLRQNEEEDSEPEPFEDENENEDEDDDDDDDDEDWLPDMQSQRRLNLQ